MSRLIKSLIADEVRRRLGATSDAVFVDVIGLDAAKSWQLRQRLRTRGISLMVVKTSLARMALKGTKLGDGFSKVSGSVCVAWGGEDFVTLCKEVSSLSGEKDYEGFTAKGGVMDGDVLNAAGVADVSKWPNRPEQLSILSGQICHPGAALSAQLIGVGSVLCGQIASRGDSKEE